MSPDPPTPASCKSIFVALWRDRSPWDDVRTLTSFPVVIGGDPVDAASLPQLRRGSEKLEDEVRWPFKSRGGSGDVMGSAVLFVHEPGAGADKLIACLRVRVAPIELIVVRRDYAVVVLDPYRRR